MVFSSFCLFVISMSYVFILLTSYWIAANFCSDGWHESYGIIISAMVDFLYMSKDNAFFVLVIVKSRKFNSFSVSRSTVNFNFGVMLLKVLWTYSMSVWLWLYTISMSSTYLKYPNIFEFTKNVKYCGVF